MGKRLIRIFHEGFSTQLNPLSGKKINIILRDKTTLYGEYVQIKNDNLLFKDSRGSLHSIVLNTISEILYDKEAAY